MVYASFFCKFISPNCKDSTIHYQSLVHLVFPTSPWFNFLKSFSWFIGFSLLRWIWSWWCRLRRRTGRRAQSSWGTWGTTTQCSAHGMGTLGLAASTNTPGSWPHSPSPSGWSVSRWWTWRTCERFWSRRPEEHSKNTLRHALDSSWSWTSPRQPPCPCRSTRSRAKLWCDDTSAGKSAFACVTRWIVCLLKV